ncbi:MAG: sigma-70 family RNA polymerase sigma factor [Oscillospiraceae bacterium]|nr:sigma-70 family RNA polymerase sigma factor [Oscillospiraceae bacterium]
MDDKAILDLYWARSENAISETSAKYGAYCYTIAYNILSNREDSEESVNDTYLAAWNTMPPRRPSVLAAFLGKMTRYISLDRWKQRSRLKRGGGEVPLCLDELEECVSGGETAEDTLIRKEALASVNRFLDSLPETERKVFLCRYWYLDPVANIAQRFGFTESKTASMLHRTRGKLNNYLAKEGLL